MENIKNREREIRKKLPCNPGGFRDFLFNGIAGYLNVLCFRRNLGRYAIKPVMELYPVAYERMVEAVAREVEALKDDGIPPFGHKGGVKKVKREKVMEILGQQLELLAEKSQKANTMDELVALSGAMCSIAALF